MAARRPQAETFGSHLLRFVRSVDNVDDQLFRETLDPVNGYLLDELDIVHFGLWARSVINEQPGLQTIWSSADHGSAITVRTGESYTRQVALAFDQRKPLWVVAADGRPLRDVPDSTGYIDEWSESTSLPRYVSPVDQPLKTSIMLPLVRGEGALGVMNLESAAYVGISPVAKKELLLLADALSLLMDLLYRNRTQAETRYDAIRQLQAIMLKGRSQAETFGSHLQAFVRSVDNVDDQLFRETRDLVYRYVRDELEVAYFELARPFTIDRAASLRTYWSSADKEFATIIKGADGRYNSQLAVSFDSGKPLWIVNPQRKPLRRADSYVDLWSGIADLPEYKAPLDQDLFTSIVVPMRRPDNRILGVMYLESAVYLDTPEAVTGELVLLADGLAVLMDLRDLNQAQTQRMRDAINDLRRIKETTRFPQLAEPQIFVAFSARADQEVVSVLTDVLNEFSSTLRIVQWNRIDNSGTITAQLAEAITRSRFGLFYLSEPQRETGGYRDSPSVVFEAGISHATVVSGGEPSGWIPLREENSPPPPWDFASERIQVIPRAADGHLNEELFRARLRANIKRLIGE